MLDRCRRLPPPPHGESGGNDRYKKDHTDNRSISDSLHCPSFSLGCGFLRLQLSENSIDFSSLCSHRFLDGSFGKQRFTLRLLGILTRTLGINSCFVGCLLFSLSTRKLVSRICHCVLRFCTLHHFNR